MIEPAKISTSTPGGHGAPIAAVESSKDGKMESRLRLHFERVLALPPAAVDWLCGLYAAIQFLDDVADGEPPARRNFDRALWELIVGLPSNSFYRQHAGDLIPLLSTAILKWQASDRAERAGRPSPTAFVWRAGYFDVVLAVVTIVHGPERAIELSESVMAIYSEDFDAYLKEFTHA